MVTLKSEIERMLIFPADPGRGVEQVLDQEEEIALDKFQKLEKRLGNTGSKSKS
ncbi:hypothetical protein IW262DRAFT_1327418 [Armillaria fumosa]|nr:hypothetical protein IW262DRAFT_1327418 [Armillaria fumosa]